MRSLGALIFVSYTRFVPKAVGTSLYDDPKQGPLGSTSSVSGAEGEAAWPLVDQTLGDTDPNDPQKLWGTDWPFSGISTFAHLDHVKCLVETDVKYDVAVVGAPFDNAVSYRPGARFGPRAIRSASSRQSRARSYNARALINPYATPLRVLDCGDIPINPFSNALALKQMSLAFTSVLSRPALTPAQAQKLSPAHPRILTLGGDHSIALPTLRALRSVYNATLAVVHFDAHLDTWNPAAYPSTWPDPTHQTDFNHGSMLWQASNEGLLSPGHLVHAGLRTRLSGPGDHEDDDRQGWTRIPAEEIDEIGVKGIVGRILDTIGTERPVYLSVDIDVLDPGIAPGTGTPEAGGWTGRELISILRGIEGLNVVAADVVEVSPSYDGKGEQTGTVAAQVGFELITSMVKEGLREREIEW